MNNPSEIAREALRQLATQKIPPTPDNYRRLYLSIAGEPDKPVEGADFDPKQHLKALLDKLPQRNAEEKRVLSDAQAAFDRKQWAQLTRILGRALTAKPTESATTSANRSAAEPGLIDPLNTIGDTVRAMCVSLMKEMVAPLLADAPGLKEEAEALGKRIESIATLKDSEEITAALRRLTLRIEFHLEDQAELRTGLLHLLQLVIDNIGELVIDERWLAGQVDMLREILAAPLNPRSIDNAERRLKEVLFKQGQLKLGLVDAQNSIKSMLAGFIGQLSSFAESTGAYHDKIDACAQKIGEAKNITQLSSVIDEVMRETRAIQDTARSTRDELNAARGKVAEAERKVAELESELSKASDLVRYDALTGALNRRGMEEVFEQEINRARRRDSPLSLAVLDIDNFKKLNDSLGHQAGDAALVHLVSTIKAALRPQDTVARYGGEEFIVILPDTPVDEASQVMVRVQRELTRHYFLHDNQKILITFSAGVTQLPHEETREQAIKRADALMYQAKTTGKNKVVSA